MKLGARLHKMTVGESLVKNVKRNSSLLEVNFTLLFKTWQIPKGIAKPPP